MKKIPAIVLLVALLGVFISQICLAEEAENRTIWFKDPHAIISEYKLSKEQDGSYSFLGKRYKEIDDISEEDVAEIPAIQIVQKTKDSVKFRSFAAYGFSSNIKAKGENFTILGLSSRSKGGEAGKPELPYYGQFIAVPKNAKVDLVIDNVKIEPVPGEYKVYPVQPSLPLMEDAKAGEFTMDKNAYKQNKYIGEDKPIRIAADVIIRGRRLIYVIYQPVLYNPAQNKLKAVWKADWSLRYSYEAGSISLPCDKEWKTEFSDSIGRMVVDAVPGEIKQDVRCKPLTVSAQCPGQGYKINTIGNGADYLIITHDNFYNQIVPLAEWKERKGYRVKITKLSEIKASTPSSTDIRNYIINAYNTWNPQPLYLLLVGDSQFLTSGITTSAYYGDIINPTDLYYAAIDGADYFPDLFMGRLPCATTAECQTMVDKVLLMEQDPPVSNSFYKNALAAGFFEDDNRDGTEDLMFIETCEAIKDFFEFNDWHVTTSYLAGSSVTPRKYSAGSMFHTGGAAYIDPPAFLRPGDTAATGIIADAVNRGACIVYYTGHGSYTAWGPPSKLSPVLQYTTGNIQNLTNGDNLSWVISIACFTAAFDYDVDCFGEAWLKKQGGGAYAFIGATGMGEGPDSAYLCLGFYECLYPNFIETLSTFPGYKSGAPYSGNTAGEGAHLGQILNFGKIFMFDRYATGHTKNQFEKFHLFGCPEQEPRLVSPQTLDVTYPAKLTTKLANFNIMVSQSSRPVKGARVCLLLEPADFYAGITDEYGKAHFEFEPNKAGEIQLTVTHKEALPFQGIIVSTVSDITPPIGTIKINNDAQYAVSTSVTLNLSAADTGSGVTGMKFSNDNVTWSAYETYSVLKSWTLTSGNGTKTVYAKFKDVMGNESSSASDTIISLAAAETPWKSNENGLLFSNYNLDNASTMGYRFKPLKDGWIIRLGGYFKGTNCVYLWDSSGKLLSSATVTSNHNWNYTDIAPVEVKANQTYTVAVYIKKGVAFRLRVTALPRTYGNITIENGFNKIGRGYPNNPSTSTTTMYGLVDIGYSHVPACQR